MQRNIGLWMQTNSRLPLSMTTFNAKPNGYILCASKHNYWLYTRLCQTVPGYVPQCLVLVWDHPNLSSAFEFSSSVDSSINQWRTKSIDQILKKRSICVVASLIDWPWQAVKVSDQEDSKNICLHIHIHLHIWLACM